MNTKLELFVDDGGSAVGQIDLHGDEPVTLNIQLTDITDISQAKSPYSQTFTVPATKNNNKLFNHIFNIGADATYNPAHKVPSFMLEDNVQVFAGSLQLTQINCNASNIVSYILIVYGNLVDLTSALGQSLLTDLDFSELDHNRTPENVMQSWDPTLGLTKQRGYYYPLIDYGYDLDLSELNSGTLSISYLQGQLTGLTATTLTDVTQSWVTNSWTNYYITIIEGTGLGQAPIMIISNTGDTLTLTTHWIISPDISSKYSINLLDPTNPYNSTGVGMNPALFRPAISNTYLVKKMLANIGFATNSTFIDSDTFAETILIGDNGDIDLNQGSFDIPDDSSDGRTFKAFLKAPGLIVPSSDNGIEKDFPFEIDFIDDVLAVEGYDHFNTYDTVIHKYTDPDNPLDPNVPLYIYQFSVVLSYTYNTPNWIAGEAVEDQFNIRWYRSGYAGGLQPFNTTLFINQSRVDGTTPTAPPQDGSAMSHKTIVCAGPAMTYNSNYVFGGQLQPGEQVWVTISCETNSNNIFCVFDQYTCHFNQINNGAYTGTGFTNITDTGIKFNYIKMNDFIPSNFKQIDYLKSICTMFNLMIIPNKYNSRVIDFIPRPEYYAAGQIKDWTAKLDNKTPVIATLISEQQNKQILFASKPDTDYYNTFYTNSTTEIYGQYLFNIDNEWVTSVQNITTEFAPTPLDKIYGTDIFLPKIAARDAQTGLYSGQIGIPRFLRKNINPRLITTSGGTLTLLNSSPVNFYPYCGNLDDPINSNIDYNFGPAKKIFYPELLTQTQNNLINLYWKDYLDDINDKNSKLIKCNIYLTPKDIEQFNYNDIIFIDRLSDDGGHYFTVNKITYIPTANQPAVVELIKVNRPPTQHFPKGNHSVFTGNMASGRTFLGGNSGSQSTNNVLLGKNNIVGINSANVLIVGNGNIVGNNTPNVILLNPSTPVINPPKGTIVVGGVTFNPDGSFYRAYNVINGQKDQVISPFSTTEFNEVNGGLDAVRNIGSVTPIMIFDGGLDSAF